MKTKPTQTLIREFLESKNMKPLFIYQDTSYTRTKKKTRYACKGGMGVFSDRKGKAISKELFALLKRHKRPVTRVFAGQYYGVMVYTEVPIIVKELT